MALIGKIREKSWLLVAVIGIAMLAFILGDFDVFRGGSQEDVYGIGTVNGEKVNKDALKEMENNARQNMYQTKQQQNPGKPVNFTEQDEKRIANQAWQATVANKLVDSEFEKIGLIVDEFELDNVLYGRKGYDPSSVSMQFKDSVTGEFAPEQLRQAITQMEESNDPQQIQRLEGIMEYIRDTRKNEKYETLLAAGVHATTLEGKNSYVEKKTVKNVTYVYQNFSKVPNDAVGKITEKEIKTYYDKHKTEEKYEQEASRKVDYFAVQVTPGAEDTARTEKLLQRVKPKFKETNNDSAFVMRFSDKKEFRNDSTFVARPEGSGKQGPTYPKSMSDAIENAEPGDVFGPYTSKDGLKVSKVVRFVEEPTATVRHILLNAKGEQAVAAAEEKADSIMKVIRNKDNFEDMVEQFSDDPGSKSNGGKYEDFAAGTMVPAFNDFSFNKPIGTLGKVNTNYGVHIIEVLDRKSTKRPILANIVKQVEPSKRTMNDVNSKVSNYIYELDEKLSGKAIDEKQAAFDSFAIKQGYTVRTLNLKDDKPVVQGFGDLAEGQLLRLAYGEGVKEGALSSAPIRDKNRVVVAMVADIIEEGVPEFATVKKQMKSEVRKEKQAQYLIDQMVGKEDLQALAREMGAKIESEGLTFSASNVQVGREPQIIGTAFSGLIDGQKSVPVKGKSGVFVVRVDNTKPAPETSDFSTEKTQIASQRETQIKQRYRSALLNGAEVIDNRKLRKYGVR